MQGWEVLWHAEHFHKETMIQLKLHAHGIVYAWIAIHSLLFDTMGKVTMSMHECMTLNGGGPLCLHAHMHLYSIQWEK